MVTELWVIGDGPVEGPRMQKMLIVFVCVHVCSQRNSFCKQFMMSKKFTTKAFKWCAWIQKWLDSWEVTDIQSWALLMTEMAGDGKLKISKDNGWSTVNIGVVFVCDNLCCFQNQVNHQIIVLCLEFGIINWIADAPLPVWKPNETMRST